MPISPAAIGNYLSRWLGIAQRVPTNPGDCLQTVHSVRPIPRRRQHWWSFVEVAAATANSAVIALNVGQSALIWGFQAQFLGTVTTARYRAILYAAQGGTIRQYIGLIDVATDAAGVEAPKSAIHCCMFPVPIRVTQDETIGIQRGDKSFGVGGTVLEDVLVLVELFEPGEQMDWPVKEPATESFPASAQQVV